MQVCDYVGVNERTLRLEREMRVEIGDGVAEEGEEGEEEGEEVNSKYLSSKLQQRGTRHLETPI